MLKRLFSIGLVILLFHAGNSLLVSDIVKAGQGDAASEKAKADVAKRGTGPKAKVNVKLKDKTKLKGYINQTGSDSFTLADSETGQMRTLAYAEVSEVKKSGGLSLLTKIGIAVGIFVGVLAILFAIGCSQDDLVC